MKNLLYALAGLLFFLTSCLKDEMYEGPATITEITYTPTTVTPDDPVVVNVKATDLQGVVSANINYSVNGTAQTEINMTAGTAANTFTGTIPKQADKAEVKFTVSVINKAGITAKSAEKSYVVGAIPPDYADLVLNEIDGNSKAIELYNKGTKALPLEGVTLIKNNGTAAWWTGVAAAGSIPAGGYILIIQDNTANPNFSGASGISPKQHLKFELKDPSGTSRGLFLRGSEVNLGGALSDTAPKSFQRIPNGTGEWKMATPTNGAANAASGDAIPQS